MGPCELVPRTHFVPTSQPPEVPGVSTASSAGTVYAACLRWSCGRVFQARFQRWSCGQVFITNYSILHRRSPSPVESWVGEPMTRYMLKWCYWRLAPPQRDWIVQDDFNFATADCKD